MFFPCSWKAFATDTHKRHEASSRAEFPQQLQNATYDGLHQGNPRMLAPLSSCQVVQPPFGERASNQEHWPQAIVNHQTHNMGLPRAMRTFL